MSRRTSLVVAAERRFLRLAEIEYTDDKSASRKWEMVQRTTRTTKEATGSDGGQPLFHIDAVDILARIQLPISPAATDAVDDKSKDAMMMEEYVVVVSQYRPPVDAWCIEFPAGLVDPGEDPITAALRELHEETGYCATREDCHLSPVLAYEPGLTDSCFHLVSVIVDGRKPENQKPKQQLDEGEFITVHLFPRKSLVAELLALQKKLGPRSVIDSKLYTFAAALAL